MKEQSFWRLLPHVALQLFINPGAVVRSAKDGTLSNKTLIQAGFCFFAFTSLMFAFSAMALYPRQLSIGTRLFQFGFMTLATLVILLPLITAVWSLLQKYACWFFNVTVPFKLVYQLASLGSIYYALIFVLSLGLYALNLGPLILELCLFGLNLTAFVLSIRLIQAVYRVIGEVSTKRALLAALSPAFAVVCLGMLIRFLTIMAIYPKLMGKVLNFR